MVKSIIKELIVILLLVLAILLALGVLFYDYIPTNKTVPSVATYATPESVKVELDEQITEEETVLVTYSITAGDINNYSKTNAYSKGKANPFSTYQEPAPDANDPTNTNSINTNTQSPSSNGNTFYNNTGTK